MSDCPECAKKDELIAFLKSWNERFLIDMRRPYDDMRDMVCKWIASGSIRVEFAREDVNSDRVQGVQEEGRGDKPSG